MVGFLSEKPVSFGASRSKVSAFVNNITRDALADIAQDAKDRMQLIVSPRHLLGTISILMYIYSLGERYKGAKNEGDWIRATSSAGSLPGQISLLFSGRNGNYPEAERFGDRLKKAIMHPDLHAVHASIAYGTLPLLIAYANDVYKGANGPKEETARVFSGVLGLVSQAVLWQSSFGHKKGIGRTAELAPSEKQNNFLQFMLHDVEGLSARMLPTLLRVVNLLEGVMKTKSGSSSGKNFTLGSAVDLVSYLIHVGYTYQQLWEAHKKANNIVQPSTWTKEILDEKASKLYTAPAKIR